MGLFLAMATIAAVDDGEAGALISQDFHLLQRRGQAMAIAGVASQAARANNESLFQGCGDADFAAEPVSHPRPVRRDAVHREFVQRMDIDAALGLLAQKARDKGGLLQKLGFGRILPSAQTDLCLDLGDWAAQGDAVVQNGDTDLELCNLAVEVPRHVALTQQFDAVHLRLCATLAVIAA
jgi:hypothetical protein